MGKDFGRGLVKLQQVDKNSVDLSSQLAGGGDDDSGDMVLFRRLAKSEKFLDKRNKESKGFSTTGDSLEMS